MANYGKYLILDRDDDTAGVNINTAEHIMNTYTLLAAEDILVPIKIGTVGKPLNGNSTIRIRVLINDIEEVRYNETIVPTQVIRKNIPIYGLSSGDVIKIGILSNDAADTDVGVDSYICSFSAQSSTFFTGITSLAGWLGALAGKTADAATLAEINATTAGATYNNETDGLEAAADAGGNVVCGASGVYVGSPTDEFRMVGWLEIGGQRVTDATSCVFTVRDRTGAQVFQVNGAGFTAQGFSFGTKSVPGLGATAELYTLECTIVRAGTTYISNEAINWLA